MEEAPWDLIIIGAGPAGLTAGIYGARSGLDTLVLEKGMPGGGLNETPLVENYPGFPNGIRGQDLASKMMEQCENAGAEIHFMDNVTDIEFKGKKKVGHNRQGTLFLRLDDYSDGHQTQETRYTERGKIQGTRN